MKNSVAFSLFLLAGLLITATSCQKEELALNEITQAADNDKQTASLATFCDLEMITSTDYIQVGNEVAGPASPVTTGTFDSYVDCLLGTPGLPGTCCPVITVYLTSPYSNNPGNGYSTTYDFYKLWGTNKRGGTLPYLNDGELSVDEQTEFIQDVMQAAQNNAPPCGMGAYNPVAYEFESTQFSGSPRDIEMAVKVTYHATCFGP
ncbi:MAG: hypothetical protein AAGB22_11445 [Bacteroidota bacterium]